MRHLVTNLFLKLNYFFLLPIEDIFAITINPYGFLGRDSNDPVKKSGLVLLESFALSMQHDQKGVVTQDIIKKIRYLAFPKLVGYLAIDRRKLEVFQSREERNL